MRNKITFLFLVLLIVFGTIGELNAKKGFTVLKGPYPGQKPPGMTPELFTPGILSTKEREYCITFFGDGRECYFQRGREILVTEEKNDKWTQPEIAPFSGKYPNGDPFISPDGKKLFFTSERQVKKEGIPKKSTVPGQKRRIWEIFLIHR